MKYRFIKLNTGKLISIRGLSEQRIKALYFTAVFADLDPELVPERK